MKKCILFGLAFFALAAGILAGVLCVCTRMCCEENCYDDWCEE